MFVLKLPTSYIEDVGGIEKADPYTVWHAKWGTLLSDNYLSPLNINMTIIADKIGCRALHHRFIGVLKTVL